MNRLLWIGGWVTTALWSLFALAAYSFVDVLGRSAMRNADMFSADPETVEWIWRMFSWGRGVSVSFILVVWGVVTLAILAVPWLFDRLTRGSAGPRDRRGPPDGVIDLAPGDYTVRTADPQGRSPVPRVGPPPHSWT